MRKNAKQARSKQTIEAILEATAQLLEVADTDQVSTNHIAVRAGVSIGTLYQYFPNKTAIFLAIAERDIQERMRLVAATIAGLRGEMTDKPVRKMVAALIKSFSGSHRNAALIRVLMATRNSTQNRTLPVDAIATLLTQTLGAGGQMRPLTETSAFVLTRSVLWTVLTATIDAPHLLKTKAFEDELVILIRGFLTADRAAT